MKKTIQILILEILKYVSIRSPFDPQNNEDFKRLHGKYDKAVGRWLLPKNEDTWRKLNELFGADSRSVVARITMTDLTVAGKHAKVGGYVVANWDERNDCIRIMEGVELVAGGWDDAASLAATTPCLTGPDAVLHVVIRRDYADKHGLTIVEELPEDPNENPLARFPDSDLIAELEDRGYIVTRDLRSLF